MKIQITSTQILKQFGCPYCGSELTKSFDTCCGEASHGETMYATEDDSSWMTWNEFTKTYVVFDFESLIGV